MSNAPIANGFHGKVVVFFLAAGLRVAFARGLPGLAAVVLRGLSGFNSLGGVTLQR